MKLGLFLFGLGCALSGARIVEFIALRHLGSILGFFIIDIPLIYFGIRRLRKQKAKVETE